MNIEDLPFDKAQAVQSLLSAILSITQVSSVSVILSKNKVEEHDELRALLVDRHGKDIYNPKTHRPVAIMAADREPGDAAKAIDDVTIGNPNASRVFDAVAEAFGRLTDGDHVQLDIHIDNDRVSIEHWSPPVRKETPMEPWTARL